MSAKIFTIFLLSFILFPVGHALADATFTNDVNIQDNSVELVINEYYTGVDAQAFRTDLDSNHNGEVNETEVEAFKELFSRNSSRQYMGYIMIDDGKTQMQMSSFDLEMENAQGNVSDEEMHVKATISYELSPSLLPGDHNIWILGHPLIEKMSISLPPGTQLNNVDGIDDLIIRKNGGRVLLEGRSGIRSFDVEGKQTFEYAVMIKTYRSSFIADLSAFPSFF